MRIHGKLKALGILAFILISIPVIPRDWPMWGGSTDRNMVSDIRGLPSKWEIDTNSNIKWKANLGFTSYGNPVIADGKVFVGTNNDQPRNPEITGDRGILMCLRESDGSFLWQAVSDKLEADLDWPEQGVCSSPAVDGKRVFYVNNRAELVCLDTDGFANGNDGPFKSEPYTGKTDADIVWKLDMMKELGIVQHNMANSSPVVWKDLVFLETSNGRDSYGETVPAPEAPSFLAVNKNTGKIIWQDNSPGDRILHGQWASPGMGEIGGVMQVFFPGGDGWLYGFEAQTGRKLWSFDLNPKDAVWPKNRNSIIATPVFHDGMVYIASGQDPENGSGPGHMYCINPSKNGDITESGLVWHNDKILRTVSTAAVFEDMVFIPDFAGFFHCLDSKTGKSLWTYDALAAVWGSPLVADGKVYLGDEDGDIVVLQAGRKMKELSEISMGSTVYSTPVAANGVLYIMTREALYAIEKSR